MTISYADRGGTKGYQVRITRNGKQYTKFFNSKERGARKRAQEYERKLIEILGPSVNATRGKKREVRTNTGVRYISETVGKYGTPCIRVTFRQANGNWASRDVSIEVHGRTKALQIAKRLRKEKHVPPEKVEVVKPPSPKAVRKMLEE
jgi:hypothetical protein